jgi:hypothetical protein
MDCMAKRAKPGKVDCRGAISRPTSAVFTWYKQNLSLARLHNSIQQHGGWLEVGLLEELLAPCFLCAYMLSTQVDRSKELAIKVAEDMGVWDECKLEKRKHWWKGELKRHVETKLQPLCKPCVSSMMVFIIMLFIIHRLCCFAGTPPQGEVHQLLQVEEATLEEHAGASTMAGSSGDVIVQPSRIHEVESGTTKRGGTTRDATIEYGTSGGRAVTGELVGTCVNGETFRERFVAMNLSPPRAELEGTLTQGAGTTGVLREGVASELAGSLSRVGVQGATFMDALMIGGSTAAATSGSTEPELGKGVLGVCASHTTMVSNLQIHAGVKHVTPMVEPSTGQDLPSTTQTIVQSTSSHSEALGMTGLTSSLVPRKPRTKRSKPAGVAPFGVLLQGAMCTTDHCVSQGWSLVLHHLFSSQAAKSLPRFRQMCQVSVLCCAVLCCAVLCCAVLCCAVLCCAVLCCAVLCCAVLCCAVLCCAVLCCAVLCCAVLCLCCLFVLPTLLS